VPTYTYLCAACSHQFDQHQAFSEGSLTVCPACAEPKLRKVFNNIGVSFNGSGFYRTDSRSESGGKAAKSSDSVPAKTKTETTSSTPSPAA